MKYIEKILNSKKTVFKVSDFQILLWLDNIETVKSIIKRLKKSWIIFNICRWIWTLKDYDTFELASKIKKKSYISMESVLQKEAVIFQDYSNTVTLISNNSLEKKVNWINYVFRKIKNNILTNPIWLINTWKYIIACKERAVCDSIYFSWNIYFDNSVDLNTGELWNLSSIYNTKTQILIQKLIKDVESKQS